MTTPDLSTLQVALESSMRGVGLGGEVEGLHRLTGGASRETFRFAMAGEDFILQRERPGTQRRPEGMAAEAQVVQAAVGAGVPAPDVVLTNNDVGFTDLGPSFFVTRAVPGETIARRILRDEAFATARTQLTFQLGAALAAIHTIDPKPIAWLDDEDELTKYRVIADELGLARPAFEHAFWWLDRHRPKGSDRTLLHGDFRLGNLIVDPQGLAAVIDWELAHVGDPMEDLGWLCVRAWRFGEAAPVAGLGTYDDLVSGYESVSGAAVDRSALRWWEIMGSLKWGIMCGLQANAHLSGVYRSVELAAIGRRITEQEYDVLALIEATEQEGLA